MTKKGWYVAIHWPRAPNRPGVWLDQSGRFVRGDWYEPHGGWCQGAWYGRVILGSDRVMYVLEEKLYLNVDRSYIGKFGRY